MFSQCQKNMIPMDFCFSSFEFEWDREQTKPWTDGSIHGEKKWQSQWPKRIVGLNEWTHGVVNARLTGGMHGYMNDVWNYVRMHASEASALTERLNGWNMRKEGVAMKWNKLMKGGTMQTIECSEPEMEWISWWALKNNHLYHNIIHIHN